MKQSLKTLRLTAAFVLLLALTACTSPEGEYSPDDTSKAPVGTGSVTAESYAAPETSAPDPSGSTHGRLTSDNSTTLRLLCDWTRTPGKDGKDTVTLRIRLSSYRLYVSARPNMGKLTVGGETTTFSTGAISIDENSTATLTVFYTASYSVPHGQPLSVTASWPFNGTYGGKEIGNVVCEGIIP